MDQSARRARWHGIESVSCADAQRHTRIVQRAVEHDGFGFVNVYSLCVTFNDVDTYDYFRDFIMDLKESDHDPTDYDGVKDAILDGDKEYQAFPGPSGNHLNAASTYS